MTYDTGTKIGRNNCHCAIQPSYAIASIYYIAYIPSTQSQGFAIFLLYRVQCVHMVSGRSGLSRFGPTINITL